MNFFKHTLKIPFVKIMPYCAVISSLLVLASMGLMLTKGFKYGLDFNGGVEIQVKFKGAVDSMAIREALSKGDLGDVAVQNFGEKDANEYLLRLFGESLHFCF